MENQFELSKEQLVEIANGLTEKILLGLKKENTEVQCIPTFITPSKNYKKGKATVFDLGGTNFRAATVEIGENEVKILEQEKKNFEEMKREGFTKENLYDAILSVSEKLKLNENTNIGYCYSFPSKSLPNGDGEFVSWSKGINIPNMNEEPIGQSLVKYINAHSKKNYGKVVVLNDTITALFAGLSNKGYDAYIGLIVGTGTNMATFFPKKAVEKLGTSVSGVEEKLPINFESGNFYPKYLTKFDDIVDKKSNNPGQQCFEKAVSGMYVGKIFREVFSQDNLPENMDGGSLGEILLHPEKYSTEYVETAYNIYVRSAKLVASSIVGVVKAIQTFSPDIKSVMLLAEGSMFWSNEGYKDAVYSSWVEKSIQELSPLMQLEGVCIKIGKMEHANLIGAALSVLS
ncbi:MAG TPA: hexokinase [Porphyromonadaceae bacterium]|nr:hexokinase [Porphyromonadaceae bacterium]